MVQSLDLNDGILLVALSYSCVDLLCEWDVFTSCSRPLHKWLIVSYACVIAFRLTHLAGVHTAGLTETATDSEAGVPSAGDFLLDLRHKNTIPRVLASFTWLLALPFFTFWTLLGTSWLWAVVKETPQCVPTVTHLWFSGFWLALCYIWVSIHVALGVVAWILEKRVRRAEADLGQIEDADVRSRWGQVSQLSGFRSLQGAMEGGLTPAEIRALPSDTARRRDIEASEHECVECSICLNDLVSGDCVRHLPACGHTFHRSCIDLWLLRRADCPLCKHCVRGGEDAL